jgi:hypothetical protein
VDDEGSGKGARGEAVWHCGLQKPRIDSATTAVAFLLRRMCRAALLLLLLLLFGRTCLNTCCPAVAGSAVAGGREGAALCMNLSASRLCPSCQPAAAAAAAAAVQLLCGCGRRSPGRRTARRGEGAAAAQHLSLSQQRLKRHSLHTATKSAAVAAIQRKGGGGAAHPQSHSQPNLSSSTFLPSLRPSRSGCQRHCCMPTVSGCTLCAGAVAA